MGTSCLFFYFISSFIICSVSLMLTCVYNYVDASSFKKSHPGKVSGNGLAYGLLIDSDCTPTDQPWTYYRPSVACYTKIVRLCTFWKSEWMSFYLLHLLSILKHQVHSMRRLVHLFVYMAKYLYIAYILFKMIFYIFFIYIFILYILIIHTCGSVCIWKFNLLWINNYIE